MKRTSAQILLDRSLERIAKAHGPIRETHELVRRREFDGVSLASLEKASALVLALCVYIECMRNRIKPAGKARR
jgi:hypothetical protein